MTQIFFCIGTVSYTHLDVYKRQCHDNATVFDKLYISNVEEGLDGIITRQKNLTITVLLSQGIPLSLIHI